MLLTYLPEWVHQFKEKCTEIRFINKVYYKYEVKYKYNPAKKRTDKITVRLLGKITEQEGFIASDKDSLRQQVTLIPNVDIKTYGVYHLFSTLLDAELISFKACFKEGVSEDLFSFAMMRWAYQSPIKRAPHYHNHDFCSEYWSKKSISDKQISASLKFVGENRETLVAWMKAMLQTPEHLANQFVMMDSTHVTSVSELISINAKGYNPDHNYDKQIRLMYIFSAQLMQPVYYRIINGNITDIKSMALCIKEMKVQDVIYIADKGFFSKENIIALAQQDLQYIIPLHRNNKLIDFTPLLKANLKKELKTFFVYQDRIIWYNEYENKATKLITYLDEKLKIKEEADYLLRTKTLPEEYTETKFYEKMLCFGTLTFTYSTKENLNAQQLYEGYKQRNEVEIMFDSYKNFLKAGIMYIQDRHVLEGWLAANFLAMIAYYKLFTRLKEAKLLTHWYPKDIIELSKSIYKVKINGTWNMSEITKKTIDLFKKLKIDYLK